MNRYFIENSNTTLRKILNKEENLDIVQNIIEAFLHMKIKKIILRPYLKEKNKNLPKEGKYGIVNVRVITEEDIQFNIGIQIMDGLYLQEKLLTYGMSIHLNQSQYEDYNEVEKTITINFLDFIGFKTRGYHKKITFLEGKDDDNIKIEGEIILHSIELPNYHKEEIETQEDEWIIYLKGEKHDLIDKIKAKNQYIKKLDDILIDYWKKETL